jgi:hypothetical protein
VTSLPKRKGLAPKYILLPLVVSIWIVFSIHRLFPAKLINLPTLDDLIFEFKQEITEISLDANYGGRGRPPPETQEETQDQPMEEIWDGLASGR